MKAESLLLSDVISHTSHSSIILLRPSVCVCVFVYNRGRVGERVRERRLYAHERAWTALWVQTGGRKRRRSDALLWKRGVRRGCGVGVQTVVAATNAWAQLMAGQMNELFIIKVVQMTRSKRHVGCFPGNVFTVARETVAVVATSKIILMKKNVSRLREVSR